MVFRYRNKFRILIEIKTSLAYSINICTCVQPHSQESHSMGVNGASYNILNPSYDLQKKKTRLILKLLMLFHVHTHNLYTITPRTKYFELRLLLMELRFHD